jgi:LmbE family N-acetylglucosaminyl deacetylase
VAEHDDRFEPDLRRADIHVPDGVAPELAFGRVTDLAIVAHPDDVEFLALAAIGECWDADDRWFGGVTCTDGAGSARTGRYASLSPDELAGLRRDEQRAAADIGRYSVAVQLGFPSAEARSPEGHATLVGELVSLLAATRPVNLYTHNLFDKHATHVAVAAATVSAVRAMAVEQRPMRMVGVEAWRDLDWLGDAEKVRLDVSRFSALADDLARCYPSQLDGKAYDVAARGRRQANATFFEPRAADDSDEVIVAIDLTPLARNDDVDPVLFATRTIDRFRDEVVATLASYL